jgi:hypothetical protein
MKRNRTRELGDEAGINTLVRTWKMKRKEAEEMKIKKGRMIKTE